MKFKLFGGLDCPDTLLAQLAVIGNTDIVTTKALAALTDHVISMLLTNIAAAPSSLGDANTTTTTTAGPSPNDGGLSATELEVRAATLKLFTDVFKPLTHPNAPSAGADRFDGFATKAVQFHENQRLQRAKAAAAAAKKFVVTATAAEIEQLSLQPATQQQQLLIAEDALSQSLVAISHVVANMARFSLTDETLMTELSMLGLAPEAVEALRGTVKAAIGAFRDRNGEDGGADTTAQKSGSSKQKASSTSQSSAHASKLAFIFGDASSATSTGDEEATTAAILRQIGLLSCPRVGTESPIGSITPFTRTSTISALQQVVKAENEAGEEGGEAGLTEETRTLAEAVVTNTNEDAAQIAVTTAFIRIATTENKKTIELTHAQARTLLNELIIARDIMREGDEDQQ